VYKRQPLDSFKFSRFELYRLYSRLASTTKMIFFSPVERRRDASLSGAVQAMQSLSTVSGDESRDPFFDTTCEQEPILNLSSPVPSLPVLSLALDPPNAIVQV
jgi:hypothetical protein